MLENQPDFDDTSPPPQSVLHSVHASCKNRSPALFSPDRNRAARATGEISGVTRQPDKKGEKKEYASKYFHHFALLNVALWRFDQCRQPLLGEVT